MPDRHFSIPMPKGRAMIDSFGGDEMLMATAKGEIRFEWSDRFGPLPINKNGSERALSHRHPFWRAASLWNLQGDTSTTEWLFGANLKSRCLNISAVAIIR